MNIAAINPRLLATISSGIPQNTRRSWHGSDQEAAYEENLKSASRCKLLDSNGFTRDNIEYRFNNLGFRSDDAFDLDSPAEGTMFLGCSFTEGVGLDIEDTWAYKLSQKLGGCFYNFSQGGTGIETAYRMLHTFADVLKIKRVYHLMLDTGQRREFYNYGKFESIGPWSYEESFVALNMTHPVELHMSIARSTDAMRGFVRDRGIELYWIDPAYEKQARTLARQKKSFARDIQHLGREYQDALIEDMSVWKTI